MTDLRERLSEILERAEQGETITITREGRPVARLVPPPNDDEEQAEVARVIAEMLEWRKLHGPKLGKALTIREMIEEGRRF